MLDFLALRQWLGLLAQLVERLNGIEEVSGSNPLGSTTFRSDVRSRNRDAFPLEGTTKGVKPTKPRVAQGRHGKHGQGRINHEGTPRDTNERAPDSFRGVQPRMATKSHDGGTADVAAAVSPRTIPGDVPPKDLPARSAGSL